jgi:hypothetical protein
MDDARQSILARQFDAFGVPSKRCLSDDRECKSYEALSRVGHFSAKELAGGRLNWYRAREGTIQRGFEFLWAQLSRKVEDRSWSYLSGADFLPVRGSFRFKRCRGNSHRRFAICVVGPASFAQTRLKTQEITIKGKNASFRSALFRPTGLVLVATSFPNANAAFYEPEHNRG